MNRVGGISLWDDNDGFYDDVISFPDGSRKPLKVRSLVGLVPLLGVAVLEPETSEKLPGFEKRLQMIFMLSSKRENKNNTLTSYLICSGLCTTTLHIIHDFIRLHR